MSKKIIRYCWPEFYRNSWIWNFSNCYINELKKIWYNIEDRRIKTNNNILRLIKQFLINPFKVILSERKVKKIFWDEWMLLYTLFPFFPYKTSTFIIHDIRDISMTTKKMNFMERCYFYFWKVAQNNIKKLEQIITPSEFTKNKIIKHYWVDWNKIHVIYSPLDLWLYKIFDDINKKDFLKKNWIETDKKILLNVWSEESRKNIITILKTMRELDEYIFIKIWKPIIKQNRESHLKFIKDNKLDNKVYFIDFVETNEDLVKFYNIADIFVFPSLFEWFWRPPIEAQACWCPVISSIKWGLKEVIWDSAVILKDPEDKNELLWKIASMDEIKNKIIKMGLKNVDRFSLGNNISKWNNLFT